MKSYFAVGVMSGTSLDGLDLCYSKFTLVKNNWTFEILHSKTLEYENEWNSKLSNAVNLNAAELLSLNSEYGFYLGEKISEFISKNNIQNLDIISSHGHTVYHQPERKFTYQIGDGRAIKILNQFPVVYDFRSQDVLMGGNGAPLVPIGDEYLFSEFDSCMNLGGFSNISFKKNSERTAFDICPVNIVLNHFAQIIGHKFDNKGEIASLGKVNKTFLDQLNQLEFYTSNQPKSLGYEFVKAHILPLLTNESIENLICTFTEHAAIQIAKVLNENHLEKVLITGGGVYNDFLIKKIKEKTECEIIIPSKEIIEFKEALIFAFMGILKLRGENNILSSATGSFDDHCSGILI